MKLQIKKGSTDKTILIFIQNSSSTTGAGLAGLAYNTSGLTCYYCRPGSAAAQLVLANQTVTGSHTDGGFIEIDSTNMPGVYRLDLSDAICASGVDSVVVMLKGASNMAPLVLEIQLTNLDLNDGVRAGLTALPNAAADAAGGLPISDAGGLDFDSKLANTNEVTAARMGALTDLIDGGRLDLLIDAIKAKTDNLPADPADDSDIDSQLTTIIGNLNTIAGYIDTEIQTLLDRLTAARAGYLDKLNVSGTLAHSDTAATYKADVSNLDVVVSTRAPESGGNVAAIKAKTDNLPSSPAAVGSQMNLADDAITSGKYDETTAFPVSEKQSKAAATIVIGTIDNTGFSPTTTQFEADDITEATDDHFNGRIIIFTSGALVNQATDITDYTLTGGRGHFTVTAMTEAPSNDDTFIIV